MKAATISISRNIGGLFCFDQWIAENYGVPCAVLYNKIASDDHDCRTFIRAGQAKKLENDVVIDGDLVWIRYQSDYLFSAFIFYSAQAVKTALRALEKAELIKTKKDRGSGFTWVAVLDEEPLSAQEVEHG